MMFRRLGSSVVLTDVQFVGWGGAQNGVSPLVLALVGFKAYQHYIGYIAHYYLFCDGFQTSQYSTGHITQTLFFFGV